MLYALCAAALIAVYIFINKKAYVSFEIKGVRASGLLELKYLPVLPPLKLRLRLFISLDKGLLISLNGKPPKKPKSGKRRKSRRIINLVKPLSIKADGRIGIEGAPDMSVILSGTILLVLIEAATAIFRIKPEVRVKPDFGKTVFDLKVEGIFLVNPGRLIIEILKSKRRQ